MARIGCGKSGGCRTCRSKKIKCDERKPTCERCERSKRRCEGYVLEYRFVDENGRTERHARREPPPRSSPPESKSKSVSQSQIQARQAVVVPFRSSPSPGSKLSLQAFESNIYVSFLLSNLFLGIPIATPWPQLHDDDNASSSATLCIQALATMYFGRVHHQKHITMRGQGFYGQALRSLGHDLQDTHSGLSLSVVTSAMILELYELVAFNSISGWLKHAGGIGRLIELRGPQRHQSHRGLSILSASRLVITIDCIIRRKRCFLSSDDWKTIPWAQEPESKSNITYLHEILSDVPGLMENADTFQFSDMAPEDFLAHQNMVLHDLTSIWTTIYEWRMSWQLQNPDSSWEVPSTIKDSPFPQVLGFSSLNHANEISLYNAILLLLFRIGFQVVGPSFTPTFTAPPLLDIDYHPHIPPGLILDTRAVAIEICKSIEYHLHEDRRRGGTFLLLFPLRLAWQTFEPSTTEAIWIHGIMELIADSTAIGISRGLTRDLVNQSRDFK